MQVVFPEQGCFAQEGINFLRIVPVVGVIKAQEHIHRGESGIALLAEKHPAAFTRNTMTIGHEGGLQAAGSHADVVVHSPHFQEFLRIGPRGRQVVENGGIVGLGQFGMVGREHAPPRCLMIVVQMIIGLPRGTVRRRPVAEERGRKFWISTASSHEVERTVIIPLE